LGAADELVFFGICISVKFSFGIRETMMIDKFKVQYII